MSDPDPKPGRRKAEQEGRQRQEKLEQLAQKFNPR